MKWLPFWMTGLSLWAGCVGSLDGGPAAGRGGGGPAPIAALPGDRLMRRLTSDEYRNSVRDVLGVESGVELPDDPRFLGSRRMGAGRATVSSRAAELYETAAREVARSAFSDATRARALSGCAPSTTDDAACAGTAITRLGERLFRRPLREAERTRWSALAVEAARHTGSFDLGMALAVSGMLQSPSFLFHVEEGRPVDETRRAYTGHEMAARLASLLWASTPDAGLLAAAAAGRLDDVEGLLAELPRLLEAPQARIAIVALFEEHLEIDRIEALLPDAGDTAGLAAAFREETRRVLEAAIFEERARFRDLFDRDTTFANETVAAVYGVAHTGSGFVRTPLPESRRGILSLGAFLAAHGRGGETSPTMRGLFVRTRLLCESIDPPPAGVSTDLALGTGATARDRLEVHRRSPACASCHERMDPIGLGLEQFDGRGSFRRTEHGATIDPSGALDGLPFEDARALGEVLRDHPALDACLSRHLYRAALGRTESAGERPELERITAAFVARGGDVLELFRLIVTSDAFRSFEVQP
jgi:hypothetical protein